MFNFNLTLCKDIVIFLFNQIFLYFLYFSNKLLQTTGQEYKKGAAIVLAAPWVNYL